MLLGYFPKLSGYEVFSFQKNQGCAALFPYIARSYSLMGEIAGYRQHDTLRPPTRGKSCRTQSVLSVAFWS